MLVHQLLVVVILMCVAVASAKSGGSRVEEKPKKEKQYWEDFTTEDWEQEEAKKRAEVEKMEAKEMFDSEYLPTLHQHGRALYRLENWAGALEVSEKVAGWHMQVSGDDSMQFAMALSNVGTTANRLGQTEIVSATMERAIGITIARFGETSYESTQIFAKMLQFGLYKGDEKPQGYSQEKYMEEIKRILDSETKGDESETEEL